MMRSRQHRLARVAELAELAELQRPWTLKEACELVVWVMDGGLDEKIPMQAVRAITDALDAEERGETIDWPEIDWPEIDWPEWS